MREEQLKAGKQALQGVIVCIYNSVCTLCSFSLQMETFYSKIKVFFCVYDSVSTDLLKHILISLLRVRSGCSSRADS